MSCRREYLNQLAVQKLMALNGMDEKVMGELMLLQSHLQKVTGKVS